MTFFWLGLFIILAIFEIITINLVSIWFALGALITTFVTLVTDNTMIQLAVFTISSFLLLVLTKSLVTKLKMPKVIPTNLDQVVDKIGLVTEDIKKNAIGEVKVLGKKWSAYSDKEIRKDEKVRIISIEGVKLKVEKIKESD